MLKLKLEVTTKDDWCVGVKNFMMLFDDEEAHTRTKEEITEENILILKETILNELDKYEKGDLTREEYSEILIYKLLLFSLGGFEEKVVHRYAWDYFDKNKKYLLESIP